MSTAINKRIPEVDLLRGFAAICVIVGHSFITTPVNISEVRWCQELYRIINSFHMELFFALAGFVYHCTNYKKFVKGKIQRILIPYFVFGILALFLHSFGGNAVNRHVPISDGIKNLFLYGGNYWFLYVMLILLLIFPWIEKVLDKDWKMEILAMVSALIYSFVKLPSIFGLNNLCYYLPYFIAGYLIRKKVKTSQERKLIIISGATSLIIYVGTYSLITSSVRIMNYVLGFSCVIFLAALVKTLTGVCKVEKLKVGGYCETVAGTPCKSIYSTDSYLFLRDCCYAR